MDNLPVIVIRFALYADLMALAGMVAFSYYALTREERSSDILPLGKPTVALALIGLLLSALGMLALTASMTGTALWAVDRQTFSEIVGDTAIGTAWLVRMAAMAVALLCASALTRGASFARLGLTGSAALALATLVWTGHAGATEGWPGTAHRLSDIVHMFAAAVWIGGIAAFAWMLLRPATARSSAYLAVAYRALNQFSRIGTVVVGLIILTGVINSLAIVGLPQLSKLPFSAYGKLLIIKLLLFGAMLLIAGVNRWKLTPAFGVAIGENDPNSSIARLRWSLITEGSAALAILALVAWLGTLEPLGSIGA